MEEWKERLVSRMLSGEYMIGTRLSLMYLYLYSCSDYSLLGPMFT